VPPDAFSLDAPRLDPAGFVATFASTYHSTLMVTQLEQILQAKQDTLMAAWQSTAPAVSMSDLVGALIAPYKVTLDSAAAAIQITQAQVTAALVAQQQWLATLVSTPGGGRMS
jgi:hypothetical protein